MRHHAYWYLASVALLSVTLVPTAAEAGGSEFPADGTRGLGRGGARMARADDPSIMTRNPALLAHLWDDQVLLGGHLALPDACMQLTGSYGWGVQLDDVADYGDGPVYLQAREGDTDLDGNPIEGFVDEPYPEVCYQGGPIFLPQIGMSTKLSNDLGVGLGFFPPDSAATNQWGDRDGTIDTPNGRRPNPLRYVRSHQNVSFFTLMGALGYRLNDWITVGGGLQWNLAVFSATTWTTPTDSLHPSRDVRTEVFGRDLFIPGLIASVHLKPLDSLDVALGFKWSDGIDAKAKLDVTSGAFGTGEVFEYIDARDGPTSLGSTIPTTGHNRPGVVDSPPIWAPQASLGIRYADRIKPRFQDLDLAHEYADGTVEDHMATERWDVELDVIYYFTSVFDRAAFTNDSSAVLYLRELGPDGEEVMPVQASVGECLEREGGDGNCIGDRLTETSIHGKDQLTVRLGGDYNILPGLFSIRAGVSYEADGQDISRLNILQPMMQRIGLHGGLTLRVAHRSDISLGYARFIHRDVRLQINQDAGGSDSVLEPKYRTPEYHFVAGEGQRDLEGNTEGGDFDGTAGVGIPSAGLPEEGPYYVNAGSFTYALDVLSLTFTQHF